MKQNLQYVLQFSILALLLCLLYLIFTSYFEGLEVKSFDTLTIKEVKDGKAIDPAGNGTVKLSGQLPGYNVDKPSNCLINKDLKFSNSDTKNNIIAPTTPATGGKSLCGKTLTTPFTSKDKNVSTKITTAGNLTCIYEKTASKYICHSDGKDTSAANFYKVSTT